ncbi:MULTISPECIES: serine/threonine-protein kinase [unclassified Corallococcus]|uniref:serine/threonine-protein kinase n=1 Tax=unclassified Corallococcus TaxID=2685029 RepID=UPI001A8D91EC|nr:MULTISPECIES: serine/threonine-protein kinase [unclassified Corallococcus]MBN9686858.1 tetratricopeptide repeat protein [Corallococcus sp. NCSPR001]WAS89307.1 tetratricopeptide repeat protein [Corallococcus sp. NCRR]
MPESTPHLDEVELLDLADGIPSQSLRERAETHLDACASCREALADFLRVRAVPAPDVHAARTAVMLSEPLTRSVKPRIPQVAQGTLLGRYVVLDRLGAGGMGVVHAAYDPSLDRRIGLKLLRAPPATGNSQGQTEQLLREAQAAARTRHPHVVAVHDVGTFGDVVFIAMELVDGGTLRQHLREAPRPWREVVRLYLQAGRGLAAAHAAGVVHRDFKPDNVLVDKEGRARVTDFGLARLESAEEAAAALGPGRTASPKGAAEDAVSAKGVPGEALSPKGTAEDAVSAKGTPDEALSPKGVPGEALSPKAVPAEVGSPRGAPRVTSVAGTPGYIAPEVLTGAPADARSDQYAFCVSLYEGLHGRRPAAPDAGGPVNLGALPRAVHALLVRGLSPEPGARHPSMRVLLDALERAAFPRISAKVATAGVGVGLAVVAATVFALRGPSPCADEPSRLASVWDADRGAALLKAFQATGAPGAVAAHEATARALDAYASAWHHGRREACEATRGRGGQSEAVMDLRMNCLERRRRELGALTDVLLATDKDRVPAAPETVQALSPLSRCADVEALSQPVPPPERPEVAARVKAVFAKLDDARARLNADRWQEAVDRVAPLVTEAEALGYKPLLGEALLIQGEARAFLRDEAAASTLRRAMLASLAGRDDLHATEAVVHQVFIDGEVAQRPELAKVHAEEAQALLERSGGNLEMQARLLTFQASSLVQQSRPADALPLLEQSLTLQERLSGGDSPRVARELLLKATALRQMGRSEESLAAGARAQALLEKAYGPDHPKVAMVLNNRGSTLVGMGRYQEAQAAFQESLIRYERMYGPGQPLRYVTGLRANLGAVAFTMGRYDEAERLQREALKLYQEQFPPGSPYRVRTGNNLSLVLTNQGRMQEALKLLQEMEAEREAATVDGRKDPVFATTQMLSTEVHLRMGQPDRAVASAKRAVALLREMGAEGQLVDALRNLTGALTRAEHFTEAWRTGQEALALHHKLAGADAAPPPDLGQVLGELSMERGDAAGACQWLNDALAQWEKTEATPLELAVIRFTLARALRMAHREPERTRALVTAARDAVLPTSEPRLLKLSELDAFLRAP